jgi:hypothetical protein
LEPVGLVPRQRGLALRRAAIRQDAARSQVGRRSAACYALSARSASHSS